MSETIPGKRILAYFRTEKKQAALGFSSMLAVTAGQLAGPLILKSIIDDSIPSGDVRGLLLRAFAYLGIVASIGFLGYLQNMIIARLGLDIVTTIKKSLFSHILTLPVAWFDAHPVGELISRTESDTERLREFFSRTGISLAANLLFFAGMMTVCFFLEPLITIWIAASLPLLMFFVFFFFDRLRIRYERTRSLYALISSLIAEFIQGIEVIVAFGRRAWAAEKLDSAARKKRDNDVKTYILERIAMSALGFFMGPFFIFLVVRAFSPRILAGTLSLGTLLVFIDYGRRLFEPLMEIAENIRGIQQARVSLTRVFGILDLPAEEPGTGILPTSALPALDRCAGPGRGLEFRHVWFRYKEDWVLEDVSFFIPSGSMTALVGPSGSGKSTTIGLLCRFYTPQKGEILYDGRSLGDLDLRAWRRMVGLVLQDSYLFPGPILENIRIYDASVDQDRVKRALELVQATDFVEALPQGLGTELRERGSNISAGEKQLLSFARALAIDPPIVVLDEATASVDVKTENRIREAMSGMFEGRTSIVVAHRLSSVLGAEQILYFEKGKILARGTHDSLMADCPEYARLVRLQFPDSSDASKASA